MFSKEEVKLAKPCYEAIKKIAGKAGKECPECKGYGTMDTGMLVGDGSCSGCNGTGKVAAEWEWEPEKWQRVIYRGKVDLVLHVLTPIYVDLLSKRGVFIKDLTPLLHWEKIEEILEGMGYYLKIWDTENTKIGSGYYVVIGERETPITEDLGKSRQEVVMRAVIELGK